MSTDQPLGGVLDHDGELSAAFNAPLEPNRFHALDRVRALAMLLGVVYHTLLFRMFTGGGEMPNPMAPPSASTILSNWLHSFRMPLFFLIAGFFARMMLLKYGMKEFLRKRWWRIGLTLVIGMFTFGPIYVFTRDMVARPPNFGGGGMGPPGAMPRPPRPDGADLKLDNAGQRPPSPPAFGPGPGRGPGRPGFRPGGPPPFGPPGGGVADRIFGPFTKYVQLNHLWFLWYLLVFITVAPFLTQGVAWLVPRKLRETGDQSSLRLVRWGMAPLILAVASTPLLLMTRPMFGWFLGLAPAIFRAFPDFVFHLDPDMAFYFAYFLTGWWLHRERIGLPGVARAWLPNLLIGLGAFWIASGLEFQARQEADPLAMMTGSGGGNIKVLAYAIYCLGSACTSFAFIGVFLRYLDYPSRTWRYLADTALWVYLIHQPLVLIGLAGVRPFNLPWWALTAVVSTFTVVVSLVLYEAIIRPTPLVRLFGPASARKAVRPVE
jgi:glucan biosynthesis protein C